MPAATTIQVYYSAIIFQPGPETVLHSFGSGNDGANPYGSLMQASADGGLLYGTTNGGGIYNSGTVFSYNISLGIETVVHSFNGNYGSAPRGDLIEVDLPAATNTNNGFSIFPKPSSGQFTLQIYNYPNSYSNDSVEVYNVLGQKIYHSVLSGMQNFVDIANANAGMYVVYLKTEEGIGTEKMIVAK